MRPRRTTRPIVAAPFAADPGGELESTRSFLAVVMCADQDTNHPGLSCPAVLYGEKKPTNQRYDDWPVYDDYEDSVGHLGLLEQ
jgi:hypothetical protein